MAPRSPTPSGRAKPSRRRGGRLSLYLRLFVVAAVAAAALALYLDVEVTHRFEGRLWTFPSRIHSDLLVLTPGAEVPRDAVVRRLDRCGYGATDAEPALPGQYRLRGDTLDVNLRSFDAAGRKVSARRVALHFRGALLAAIEDARRAPLQRVEMEPELLALVFGPHQEERDAVRLQDVPKSLVQSVLAAEDSRFYSHAGLDPLAIGRAGLANLRSGRIVQGGSTITQQTVKNLYLGQERTWWRKIREAGMAVVLDLKYPKDRILEVYLNEVYLGQRGPVAVCGVQAASRYFFGRDVRDLSLAEGATLAGMIRNPGGYNPFVHADRAKERRDQVLDAMVDLGFVSKDAAAKAKSEPIRLGSGSGGQGRAPYLVALLRSQLAQLYGDQQLAEEGLEIWTTVDTLVQEAAETALTEGLARLDREAPQVRRQKAQRTLQGATIVLDPRTGAVLALVGGRDYQDSQFDRAVQAKRQPGSCFKPFVYAAGFERAREDADSGLTPASVLENSPLEIPAGGRLWQPSNYDGTFGDPVTVRTALEHSLNVPTVRAALRVGLDRVVDAAERCGISKGLSPLPSLALGAQEVTPLELAAAYTPFAAGGRRTTPLIVKQVNARDGRRLERAKVDAAQALSPQSAYLVTDILRGVLVRGTAAAAASLGFEGDAAGKTGTTDDTRDAWFVGYTPTLLALVWVGYDDNAKTGLTGATGALPIWVHLMMRTRGRWAGQAFQEPPGIVRVDVDPASGERAVDACPDRVSEAFAEGTEPSADCHLHAGGFRRWLRRLFHRGN